MEKNERGLSAWQLTMLAVGTVVGGSFFLGSAVAIKSAGPAIVLAYALGGLLVYIVLFALSEMTVADPSPGSFRTFAEQAYGPAAGFVVGWVYWTGLVLAMSSEAMAVSIFLRTWFPGLSLALLGTLVIGAVSLLNLLGADRLSKLESGLAVIKLLAIVGFSMLGLALISGAFFNLPPVGTGALSAEPLFPGGLGGIAGSMLIVMFTYAGFEVIGLAASEARNPHRTVPRAIAMTVILLVGLYTLAVGVLLPLIPTGVLTTEESLFVAALHRWGLGWAGTVVNIVLVSAILSTMLAAMFGLGRMIRSLAEEGHAPVWIKDDGDIPYRGILFSGFAMLVGLGLGFILPQQVYLFLVSSGGFALLFAYAVILVTHYKFRKTRGCPPKGNCQLPGFPFVSWFATLSILAIIASMPLIPGQASGLLAGLILVAFYAGLYIVRKSGTQKTTLAKNRPQNTLLANLQPQYEFSKELTARKSRESTDKKPK